LTILIHFPALGKVCQFHLIWDLKKCMYPFALKMVPMERVKCFHDFHHWKFNYKSVDLEFFAISTYKKKLHYNNCKVDCVMNLIDFHVKLNFLKVNFSVLTLFVVIHVTSNPKKLLCTNFWNIVARGSILKIKKHAFHLL